MSFYIKTNTNLRNKTNIEYIIVIESRTFGFDKSTVPVRKEFELLKIPVMSESESDSDAKHQRSDSDSRSAFSRPKLQMDSVA